MKKLILAILLFAASFSFAQEAKIGWTISTTIDTAGAGLTGVAIMLPSGSVPVSCWLDTLTDASTLSFDVYYGAVTQDSVATADFRTLGESDDGSTAWTATLADDAIIPLDPTVMMALLGRSDGYAQQTVWIIPLLSAKQDEPITIYIRVRYI